jgi:hypothetical protein
MTMWRRQRVHVEQIARAYSKGVREPLHVIEADIASATFD